VHNVIEPLAPVFAEIRERVTRDWKTERGEKLNEQFYANLRDTFTIVVEMQAVDTKGTGGAGAATLIRLAKYLSGWPS